MGSQALLTYDRLMDMVAETNQSQFVVRPNTRVRWREGDYFSVYLYDVGIATVYHDRVKFDLVQKTVTTKNRINDFLIPLGWKLMQRHNEWIVETLDRPRHSMPYAAGMTLTAVSKEN